MLRSTGPQPADDPGPADATKHLDAELGELLRDKIRGAPLLEAEFGMRVDVVPPFRQFAVEFRDPSDQLHASSSCCTFAALLPSRCSLAIRLAHGGERAIVTAGIFGRSDERWQQ